jgi:hypothetical protein
VGGNGTDPTLATNVSAVGSVVSASVTTSWANFTVSATVPNCYNLIVALWTDSQFSANDALSMTEAGLYDQTDVRDWLPRHPAEELALCQRYYEKSFDMDTAPTTNSAAAGVFYSPCTSGGFAGTSYAGKIGFKTQKRADPTITLYNPFAASNDWAWYTAGLNVAKATTVQDAGQHGFNCILSSANSGGTLYSLVLGHWSAEAEL